jgi:hypothetical protein
MYRIAVKWRLVLRDDRGETGPLGYAVMVSAIVLLAVFVAAWGRDVAEFFMNRVEDVPAPSGE